MKTKTVAQLMLSLCVLASATAVNADPVVVHASISGNSVNVTWNSVSNGYYRVLSRSMGRLNGGFWETVSSPYLASGISFSANLALDRQSSGRLFSVLFDAEGTSILFPPGAPPLVWDETEILVITRPQPGEPPIEMISLFEVSETATNFLGSVTGTNLTEGRFTIDMANLANGQRSLMAVAYGENDTNNPTADSSTAYTSAAKSMVVTNGIFFPPYSPTSIGWKLKRSFGTIATSGTYGVDIWAYNEADDEWWQYAVITGDLTDRDPNGYINIEDYWVWDPSIPDYRPRNPDDSYRDEGIDEFYLEFSVTNTPAITALRAPYDPPPKPTGPPPNPIYRKPFAGPTTARSRLRLSSVVEDRNTLPLHEDSIDRDILDGMVESMYLSLAYISGHWNFVNLQFNGNQFPGDGKWNKLTGQPDWRRFAYALAARYSPGGYPVNPPLITHVFSFTHGGPKGLYSGLGGTGLGNSVTPMILNAMGFQKTNGLTYAFFDACEVFADGAALPNLVLINGGSTGEISLADLIKKGLYPHYACGWSSTKFIALLSGGNLNYDHVDYIVAYAGYLFDPDPATGWPRFTYQEVRDRAVKLPNSTSDRPTASRNWAHVGCNALKVHY